MNNFNKYKYFSPREIVVGMFESNNINSGFITCKFMDKGWLKTSTFKRLTDGYLPSQMKDTEAQLKKTIYNKVITFENIPIEGFQITDNISNIYEYVTKPYNNDEYGDIIIKDPRGFQIGIDIKSFVKIISTANINNGKLIGKYVYAWSINSHQLILIKEDTKEFNDILACRNEFENREKPKKEYVKKNQFIIGHAYTAAKVLSGDWIYAGIHDTYSEDCHLNAFYNGKYDINIEIENEKTWPSIGYGAKFKTSVKRMIFFPVKFNALQPWVARDNIVGIFNNETKCPNKFQFINSKDDFVPATIESINEAMSISPAFQKIDFNRFKDENKWESLDIEVFCYIFRINKSPEKLSIFPFSNNYYMLIKAGKSSLWDGDWIRISTYNYTNKDDIGDWRIVNLSTSNELLKKYNYNNFYSMPNNTYKNTNYAYIYSMIDPIVPVMYFENGKRVPQQLAINFIPVEIKKLNSKYF